ncbi:hypothetical protein SAMN04488056_103364 [Cohaesibacter marisflavi]|uniref:Lipoprotein n=1 Tax=Cohaesibacter marisflavi TaxID=655353 RepID=A0A1I5EUW7_9HYPH|nr:hypothetical protein [Cohaesibacter marisflavi]SFO15328.1 hypothetical protein SAMN04488056_103364 [Cohaesibacter marisflavi]
MTKFRTKALVPGIALGALLPLLAACQTTSCTGDARYDDYWCARSNLNNGVYQQQTNQLQSIASHRQYQAANAQANMYDEKANLSARQAELNRLRAALAQRQQQLSSARANNGTAEQISRLEADVAALRAQVETLMQTQ